MALTLEVTPMCRNIRTLFNFEPPVTDEEIRAASLQFVRKVSGFNKPSKVNEAAFLAAVDEVAAVSRDLLTSLETNAPPRNREEEAAKARARTAQRFPTLDPHPPQSPMKGFVYVASAGFEEDEDLERWVGHGLKYAMSLPPKAVSGRRAPPSKRRKPTRR